MNQLENNTPETPFLDAIRQPAIIAGAGLIAAAILNAQSTTPPTDLQVLNYALTLEHLEAAFYNQGLRRFSSTDFGNSTAALNSGDFLSGNLYAYLSIIRDHENAHVRSLTAVIRSGSGTPVSPCTYNFGFTTADAFLATAQLLENTGVMAYDGAVSLINSGVLRTAAASIATVEARHASYLNVINGGAPAPEAFDTPKTMAQILAAAGGFIVSCPAT